MMDVTFFFFFFESSSVVDQIPTWRRETASVELACKILLVVFVFW